MDGIFSLWSEPRPGHCPDLSRLELIILALSVLEWRRWNGRALLFCDHRYARYLESLGLIGLWDDVDEEAVESANALDINPAAFSSIARLMAFNAAAIPFTSLDCDLIVWRSLASEFTSSEIAFAHWESTDVSPIHHLPGRGRSGKADAMPFGRSEGLWHLPAAPF